MTTAEIIQAIRNEIERLKENILSKVYHYPIHRIELLDDLLAFLDTLEPEKPKPISTEDMPYITDEHFYEREPADSFKYKLAEYMTKCCTKKEGPYGYTYGISAESILKMAEEELLKRGVVQKPAWSEAVKWLVDDDYDELTDKGRFILGSAGLGYNGYYIPYSDLLKLPKEDEQ